MKTQIINDVNGLPTGVFIPIEDWELIKKYYPNIEKVDQQLPQWQKDILDSRLADLDNPNNLGPIDELFRVLDSE
ncbi:addiction module component CHP02574 family protein [Flavobacterium aurantiibacter]|uniref:Addiction module component CHP02574 family protein n=1 Tax=Flavobacterium aurantiibacter TaxID=2023067 RepID=A0A256A5L0_9FLAO|nr:addiction module component CHP02574 family protein [Flavobacterium aurantiibacter]OYQ49087.1 addiction module component CHP02574 family protein [Flavobacterium aurantiibacter]